MSNRTATNTDHVTSGMTSSPVHSAPNIDSAPFTEMVLQWIKFHQPSTAEIACSRLYHNLYTPLTSPCALFTVSISWHHQRLSRTHFTNRCSMHCQTRRSSIELVDMGAELGAGCRAKALCIMSIYSVLHTWHNFLAFLFYKLTVSSHTGQYTLQYIPFVLILVRVTA